MEYKISIIIPLYNGEKYVEKIIQSLSKQTIGFKNLEIIFVDDNSSDNTQKILKNIDEKYDNCKTILLKNNTGGPGKPRNIGIKNASSEYIMYLDQDDKYENNTCEIALKNIEKYKTDVLYFDFYETYLNSDKIRKSCYQLKEPLIISKENNNEELYYRVCGSWSTISKKEYLIKHDIKFLEDCVLEDVPYSIDTLAHLDKVIIIPDVLYTHYNKSTSLSHTKDDKQLNSQIQGMTYIKKSLEKQDKIPQNKMMGNFILHWIETFVSSYKLNFKTKKELLNKIYEFQNNLQYKVIVPQKLSTIINNQIKKKRFNTVIFFTYLLGIVYTNKLYRKFHEKFIIEKI